MSVINILKNTRKKFSSIEIRITKYQNFVKNYLTWDKFLNMGIVGMLFS